MAGVKDFCSYFHWASVGMTLIDKYDSLLHRCQCSHSALSSSKRGKRISSSLLLRYLWLQLIIGGQEYTFRRFDFARKMDHESGIQSKCTETFCRSLLSLDVLRHSDFVSTSGVGWCVRGMTGNSGLTKGGERMRREVYLSRLWTDNLVMLKGRTQIKLNQKRGEKGKKRGKRGREQPNQRRSVKGPE